MRRACCPSESVLSSLKTHFHELQANRAANQSQISKFSAYYKSSSPEELASKNHLNNALYFSVLFSKTISDNLIRAAQDHVKLIEDDVLKAFGQKLLRMNQWPTAEKLICTKFDTPEAELMKFEIFALNGNYRKVLDQVPQLGKTSSIPQNVQFQTICILNTKDGILPVFEDGVDWKNWRKLLQLALKGRLLSLNPPTFMTFLRIAASLSRHIQIEPNLLMLGFTKSTEASLEAESIQLLKSIFSTLTVDNLMVLSEKLQNSSKPFPEELISSLLEQLCKHPIGTNERTTSSLLGWIMKFRPEKYTFDILMRDYKEIIDEKISRQALEVIGLCERDTMKFIEFCVLERDIFIEKKTLKRAVDISSENYNYVPSDDFMRIIHQKGYVLSSIFYLNHLKKLVDSEDAVKNLTRAFECFKLIEANVLHGDLLQKYLQVSQKLLESSVRASNLDFCYKIYTATAKYEILHSLTRPKSFRDFIFESYSAGKFVHPFRTTSNLECIQAVIDCTQQDRTQGLAKLISERFSVVALRTVLTNLDFSAARKLHVYMNNQGFNDGGIAFTQNVLQRWLLKLKLRDPACQNEIKF